MKKRETKHVNYVGDANETNVFQFRVLLNKVVYNAVYKDEYMQSVEIVREPLKNIDDDTIEEICEMVENWFITKEN